MMLSKPNILATHGLLAMVALSLPAVTLADHHEASAKPVTEQIVDVQTQLAKGPYPGVRANHTKGIVATGTFTPAADAAKLSKAPHLQSAVPVVVRFSNAGGVPTIADASPKGMPKGMAIRFQLPDEAYTDIVSFSVDRFPVQTPEKFLALLKAIAASGPDAAKPTPLERFLEENPTAKTFVKQPKPIPVSFATQSYHGVNAFRFTNAAGESHYGRYRIVPVAGEQHLSAEQAAAAGNDFLMEELPARLQAGPASFKLLVQLAGEGDVVDDPTQVFPQDNPVVELGTLTLKEVVADSRAEERKLAFNPLILPEGIQPSNDPVLLARPAAYAVSVSRRLATTR